ncbi:MAG: anthranilate phosphoribosyltransferase [Pyrinomonadaceae bacterium]
MTSVLENYRLKFERGDSFEIDDAEQLLNALIEESNESLLSSVFVSWNRKGIDEHEIYAIAKLMRERMKRVNSKHETCVDIVGTGGSKAKTFNVSTAAAFVVAGEGVAVAKHGNKAATSNSGSADVLSELGLNHALDPVASERSLNEIGICFMFAPNHHRLSPTLAKVRRSLGFPTIFNCVGPLCNPAGAQHQLIGVWDITLLPKMAGALAKLGTKKSWVVHGEDGLDEISVTESTYVAEVISESVNEFKIAPSDFGTDPKGSTDLRAATPENSARLIRQVLAPSRDEFLARTLVEINAAAAIYLAGFGDDLFEASNCARDSIQGGRAHGKLEALINYQRA